jgi:hypothetical protein
LPFREGSSSASAAVLGLLVIAPKRAFGKGVALLLPELPSDVGVNVVCLEAG